MRHCIVSMLIQCCSDCFWVIDAFGSVCHCNVFYRMLLCAMNCMDRRSLYALILCLMSDLRMRHCIDIMFIQAVSDCLGVIDAFGSVCHCNVFYRMLLCAMICMDRRRRYALS